MAFNRRSKEQIYKDVRSDIQGELPASSPWLRRNLFGIIAKAMAGVAHGLYGALDQLAKNLLPTTKVESILAIWCYIFGVDRLAATKATGPISVTGVDASVIPSGTIYQIGGVRYVVDADITIAAGVGAGTVTADEAGAGSNIDAGATLTLVAPVAGVDNSATVTANLGGGADIESVDAWRDRLLFRIQNPPQGGSKSDYIRWAKAAHPAVSDVWVYPHEAGFGTITIRFMSYGSTANGIPDPAVVTAVASYIETVRPVQAKQIYVFAPVAKVLDWDIALQPNTVQVQTAVKAELDDMVLRDAVPGGQILLSRMNEAVSLAEGEEDHALNSPSENFTCAPNEIAVPGIAVWSAL